MIRGIVKKHPLFSTVIVGGILYATYTAGKYMAVYNTECYHVIELNNKGSTTIFNFKNGQKLTAILKPAVEATVDEVTE